MDNSIGVAMVPGAGLGGWIWRDLAPLVRAPTLAVEFPGRDRDLRARQALGLQEYAAHVHRQIVEWDVDRVVIAAHSLGGVVGQSVAPQVNERLAGFMAISAVIPRARGSFVSCFPWPKRVLLNVVLRTVGTKPPESAIRKGLANDLSPELAAEVVDRFTPESRRVYFDPTPGAVPDVPRLYVKSRKDKELDGAFQDRMIANLGSSRVVTLDSGHLTMLSHPPELADVLNQFVSELA